MRGLPTEGVLEFFLAGNQNRRITGPPRAEFARNFTAGDALGHTDDFENREAAAIADVEGLAGNAVDFLECAGMRIGDIEHVYVVADAGAVRCGVVRPEDI